MLNLMKLERRIVLDGAAVAGVLNHASDHDAHGFEHDAGDNHISEQAEVNTQQTEAVADVAALLSDTQSSNAYETETSEHMVTSLAAADGYNNTIVIDEDTVHVFERQEFGSDFTKIKITDLEKSGDLQLDGVDVTLGQEIDVADINAGKLIFTPNKDANGLNYSNFKFKVGEDTAFSDSYVMTINVTPIQDAPTAVNSSIATQEDTDYVFKTDDFIFNDVDVEDSLVKIQIAEDVTHGALKLNGSVVGTNAEISAADIQSGRLTFSPALNASGDPYANFQFKVSDGKDYSVNAYDMDISVEAVNDLPTGADKTLDINEDEPYVFTVDDFGFSDTADNGSLSKIQITQLETAGSLKLNGVDVSLNSNIAVADIVAGKLVFTPDTDANGEDYASFRFKVHDGTDYSVDPNTVTINIAPSNDPPTAADHTVATRENTDYTFNIQDFKFDDVDGDNLSQIQITQLETAGSLKLNGAEVTLNQNISVADITAGRLVFTPAPNANGDGYANFRFMVHDGTVYSTDSYTMTVDVVSVNDLPTAADNTVTTNEDTAYTFEVADFGFSDTDGDTLKRIQLIQLETAGTLKLDGAEITLPGTTITADDIAAGKLTFTPDKDANGEGYANFRFKVHDGTDYSAASYKMTVDVTPVNDPPTSASNTVTTSQNEVYTFNVADFKFDDVDGDSLNKLQITQINTENIGTLLLNGTAVTANDEISVSDVESGRLTFAPATDAVNRDASFKFKVHDGTVYSLAASVMTIQVEIGPKPPTSDDNTVVIDEDNNYIFKAEDFNFEDPDGGSLTQVKITQLETAGALKLNGEDVDLNTVVSVEDINAGNLVFIPNKDANGKGYAVFKFKVHDGEEYSMDSSVMTIDVTPVQDAPTAADNFVITDEDSTYTFTVEDFIFNDVDTEDHLAKIQITGLETAGSLRLNGTDIQVNAVISVDDIIAGRLTFTPDPDDFGDNYATFQFKVNDNKDFSVADYTMTVNVREVPEGPIGPANPPTMDEDHEYTFEISDFEFENVDFAKDFLKIQITKTVSSGTLQVDGEDVQLFDEIAVSDIEAGKLTFIPNQDANDENSGVAFDFQFRVFDNQTQKWSSTPYMMEINVTPVNDPPMTEDNSVTLGTDETDYVYKPADFRFEDNRDTNSLPNESNQFAKIEITSWFTREDGTSAVVSDGTLKFDGVDVIQGQIINVADIEAGKLVFVVDDGEYGDRDNNFKYADYQFKVIDEADGLSVHPDADGISEIHTQTIYKLGNLPPVPTVQEGAVYIENHEPTFITGEDAFVVDPDGDQIKWLRATITNVVEGDRLDANVSGTNINKTYDPDTGTLLLSGVDSAENYTKVLQSITYKSYKDNESLEDNENPNDKDRIVEFSASDDWDNISDSPSQTRITVVAVNDAPVIYGDPLPQVIQPNETIIFSAENNNILQVDDPDAFIYDENGDRVDQILTLTVRIIYEDDNARQTVETSESTGTIDELNAQLAYGEWTPKQDYVGDITIYYTVNDGGAYGSDYIDPETGEIMIDPETGNPINAPREDSDLIRITITQPGPGHIEEPSGIEPISTLVNIVRPPIGEPEPVELGLITFPGPVQPTGEFNFTRALARYPGCEDAELYRCCTLEESLRIGCRLAPAINPDARLCNVEWKSFMQNELGWQDPFVDFYEEFSNENALLKDREYFNEELDLFNDLFLRGPDGESFNDFGAKVLADAFGMNEEQEWAQYNRDEEHDVFSQVSMQTETFNDFGPQDLKATFFSGREGLDVPPGRWRNDNGSLEDC